MTTLSDQLQVQCIKKVYWIDDEHRTSSFDLQALAGRLTELSAESLARIRGGFSFVEDALSEIFGDEAAPSASDISGELERVSKDLELNQHVIDAAYLATIAELGSQESGGKAVLEKLFAEASVAVEKISFSDWKVRSATVFGSATESDRILLLIDELNKDDHQAGIVGEDVIRSVFADADHEAHIDCLVVTNAVDQGKELEESHRLYKEILEQQPNARRVFVFSKNRFMAANGDQLGQQFAMHLNRIYAARLGAAVAQGCRKALADAVDDTVKWLSSIPLSEFHGSVFVSSEIEGLSEIETLLRLVSVRQRVTVFNAILGNEEIKKLVTALRAIPPKHLGTANRTTVPADLAEFRNWEIERSGPQTNSFQLPIACGDVFEIEITHQVDGVACIEKTTAVLLANACDLMIRTDGSRKLSHGYLVPMEKATREKLGSKLRDNRYTISTGQHKHDQFYYFENLDYGHIPLEVLDLCWLSITGEAKVSNEAFAEIASHLPTGMQAMAASLKDSLAAGAFQSYKLWGGEIVRSQTAAEQDGSAIVSYSIKRVWRLAPEYAAAALLSLTHTISRPSFDHDLGKWSVDSPKKTPAKPAATGNAE